LPAAQAWISAVAAPSALGWGSEGTAVAEVVGEVTVVGAVVVGTTVGGPVVEAAVAEDLVEAVVVDTGVVVAVATGVVGGAAALVGPQPAKATTPTRVTSATTTPGRPPRSITSLIVTLIYWTRRSPGSQPTAVTTTSVAFRRWSSPLWAR
jgi:hypothetical protein